MKRIMVKIPRGYAGLASIDPLPFVEAKYGGWIASNLQSDYVIELRDAEHFIVRFTVEDAADAFVATVGGIEVAE